MKQKRTTSFLGKLLAVSIAFTLVFGAQPAWATVEGDQRELTDEEIAAALEDGQLNTVDEQNDVGISARSFSIASAQGDVMRSYSGATRYETAALQSADGWTSSRYAIVAGGEGWPDALAATSLAGALDCPLLLTDPTELSTATKTELSRLGVDYVLVVGGEPSVASEVVNDLGALGIQVKRLAGATRYETQLAIYEYGLSGDASFGIRGDLWAHDTVVVASGVSFADALSFSPVAYDQAIPVFLTDETGSLSELQENALIEGARSNGLFQSAILLGEENRITRMTAGFLEGISYLAAAKTGSEPVVPQRLCGTTRYETSVEVARWAVGNAGLTWNRAAFTTGEKPYDALGGGALQGKTGSVLLLVDNTEYDPAIDAAAGQSMSMIRLFGDKTSIPNIIRMDMADRFGFSYADIVGLKVYIDAGHGWNSSNNGVMDYGASGSGYNEWQLTSELARATGDELRSTYGIETYVNDKGGWYALRQAEAQALGCDLLISIHFNAGGGTGTESFIHSYNAHRKSQTLQSKVHPSLVQSVGLRDRGMKEAELAVCGGRLPAVLLEVCFIDKQSDINAYTSAVNRVARGIAAGIAS